MKCLTIKNPWAAAILQSGKNIENRPWAAPRSAWGRRFLVHAGKTIDDQAVDWFKKHHRLPRLHDQRGVILGSVELIDCIPAEDCFESWCNRVPGSWAWRLRLPRLYKAPIECRGMLGLFEPKLTSYQIRKAERNALTPSEWHHRHRQEQVSAAMTRDEGKPTMTGRSRWA